MNLSQLIEQKDISLALKNCLLSESPEGRLDRRALIRDWLYRERYAHHDATELAVPDCSHPGWPEQEEWEASGITCQRMGQTFLLSAGSAWRPQWLEQGNSAPFLASDSHQLRRQATQVPLDHFLSPILNPSYYRAPHLHESGHPAPEFGHYQAPGQRDAVRRALFAPAGSTLLVNLPTGTGKTLVAQALTLTAPPQGALCLLIAPTTALVMELARRFRDQLTETGGKAESVTAWHGDLPVEDKNDTRQRIRSGEQRLIVTSPEAACGSLQFALFEAARQGGLRHVIIDEAHIVASWGNAFRPQFQQLGGLIRGLKRIARDAGLMPCSTLLMSATITEASRKTLRDTFGEQMIEVHASHLRPEPDYWCCRASGFSDKRQKVLQALDHAPRPLILYVTRPEEAEEWAAILRDRGYQRLATFTGDTGNARQARLEQWDKGQLDIMIATSAFGVGMDKNDVRTVLHATVPENMDRFYQEVGRGGRDGYACTSLLIYQMEDLSQARKLASQRQIKQTLGLIRWKKLWAGAERVADDLYRIDMAVIHEELQFRGTENRLWNLRTVLMMVRAGVLELDSDLQSPPDRSTFADIPSYEAALEKIVARNKDSLVVRILIGGHTEEELWENRIIPSRERTRKASLHNHTVLRRWLDSPTVTPLCDTLVNLYSLDDFVTGHACGSCPACRARQIHHGGYLVPSPVLLNLPAANATSALRRWQALSGLPYPSCFITYPPVIDDEWERAGWYHRVATLLVQLHRAGIVQRIWANRDLLHSVFGAIPRGERLALLSDELPSDGRPMSDSDVMGDLAELIFPAQEACRSGYLPPFSPAPLQLTLIPHDMPDPHHPGGAHYVHLDNPNWIAIDQLERKLASVDY